MNTSLIVRHKLLIAIVLLYAATAIVYSIVNPLFEAPDEVWHYGYVHWIAAGNGLSHPDDMGSAGVQQWAQEGSQPPLYYLAAGLLVSPLAQGEWNANVRYNPHSAVGNADVLGNRNHLLHGGWDDWPWPSFAFAVHLARLFSILLGAVTVTFAYLSARLLVPAWTAAAPLAAALVAFAPQFLFISASVSNDNMINAVSAAGVWLAVAIACDRLLPRWQALAMLGVLVGMAALSKLSGLLLGPLALSCLAIAAARRRSWRLLLGGGTLVVLAAAVVAGWWYWRNWHLYGDPLGLSAMFTVLPARDEVAGTSELLALAPGVWRSAWAVFGWFNITVPDWLYWLYSALALAGFGGWAWLGLCRIVRRNRDVSWLAAALLAAWTLAITAALVRWAQINYPQGRLLFPAIAAAMPLLATGLLAWSPPNGRKWLALSTGIVLAALALTIPFVWIVPAYAQPPLLAPGAVPPNSVDLPVGEHVHLLGYDYSTEPVAGGEAFDITLYWSSDVQLPADYSVFVHLVDEVGIVQAQSDSHPARGSRPTSRWQPGDVVVDQHRLLLPTGLAAPGNLRIEVGMYEYATGERLPSPEGDTLALGEVATEVQRSPAGVPNPTYISFAEKIALIGYEVGARRLRPGDELPVVLWWEGLAPMDRDYVAFVHVLLPPDAVWAQEDRMPRDGNSEAPVPTSTWAVGQTLEDRYILQIPADAPAGVYEVAIGWYDKDSYDRLAVNFDDSDVIVARVRVEP